MVIISANVCSLKTNIEQANEMFAVINDYYYDNSLSIPTIQFSFLHKRLTHSRYATNVWRGVNNKISAEFTIDSSLTNLQSTAEIFKEMLYCCVLHYCKENNIKYCSGNSHFYLNKKFKDVAEKHGLIIGSGGKYGHFIIGINKDSEKLVNEYKWAFLAEREKYAYGNSAAPSSHARKYECPICGFSFRTTQDIPDEGFRCNRCGVNVIKSN